MTAQELLEKLREDLKLFPNEHDFETLRDLRDWIRETELVIARIEQELS